MSNSLQRACSLHLITPLRVCLHCPLLPAHPLRSAPLHSTHVRVHAASSTNLQTFLEQRLPSIVFESTALASTGKHPPPIWQFKEWVLNDDEILDEVAAAVASASSDHQLGPLYALQPRSSTNTVESEAGLRAVLDPVMCAVATALGRAGHGGCRWLLEATPPSAPAAPTAPVAAAVAAAATVEVKGPFKKPGFELFDRSRRVRSFLESKFP